MFRQWKMLALSACLVSAASFAAPIPSDLASRSCITGSCITDTVDRTIRPIMQRFDIPGMSIAVTIDGQAYFFNYGIASRQTQQPVTENTLFEIGSLSKTFTATLASYAAVDGSLSLADSVSKHVPALRGSRFDDITLLNVGTYTAGGLPLQLPPAVATDDDLIAYLRAWRPEQAPGTQRAYSNPSIGLLGLSAAASMRQSFDDALEKTLFPALGMTSTYLTVPADQQDRYAQGYTAENVAVRLHPAVMASPAYGAKSDTTDLIRFVDLNMRQGQVDGKWREAIENTHTGYFQTADTTQDLVWEQYAYPVSLARLLAGNSAQAFRSTPVTALRPPMPPRQDVLINKTGSTDGFAAYIAFVPAKRIGIVILANKRLPIPDRIHAAFAILSDLDRASQ